MMLGWAGMEMRLEKRREEGRRLGGFPRWTGSQPKAIGTRPANSTTAVTKNCESIKTLLPLYSRFLRLRGTRTYQIRSATMAAVQVTKDALDPSNSSKNTLKIENVSMRL